jgi:hypothetical protein
VTVKKPDKYVFFHDELFVSILKIGQKNKRILCLAVLALCLMGLA